MNIASRVLRLEDYIQRPGVAEKIDWQPYLALLTDEQLDRFEELLVKMGGEDPTTDKRPLDERVSALDAGELLELQKIGETMGLEW